MMRLFVATIVVAFLFAEVDLADGPRAPAGQAPAGAAKEPPVDPAIRKILDALEAAGGKSIRAKITHEYRDLLADDRETRIGTISFQARQGKEPAKFALNFVERIHGRKQNRSEDPVDYAFNGEWFSIVKHRAKQMMFLQVAAKGQAIQPLEIGKSPFPLPIGQKAEAVLKHFDVTRDKPDPKVRSTRKRPKSVGPETADYLRLITKRQFRQTIDFLELEIWVDRETGMPVKGITLRGPKPTKPTKVDVTEFGGIATDVKFDPAIFRPKARPGWTIDTRKFRPRPPARSGGE